MGETEIKTPTLTEQFMVDYHFAQQNLDILRANNAIKIAQTIPGGEGKRLLVYAVLNGLVILDQNSTELKKKIESEIGANRSKALDMYLFDTLQSFQEVYKDESQDLNFKTILKDQEFEFCEVKRSLHVVYLFKEIIRSYSPLMLHDEQRIEWLHVILELFGDVGYVRSLVEKEIFMLIFAEVKNSIICDVFFPEICSGGYGLGDETTLYTREGKTPFEILNAGVYKIFYEFLNRKHLYTDPSLREYVIERVFCIHHMHKSLRDTLQNKRGKIEEYLEDRQPDVYKSDFKINVVEFENSGIQALFEKYFDDDYDPKNEWYQGLCTHIESVYVRKGLLPK
jgi:hypothetical protein